MRVAQMGDLHLGVNYNPPSKFQDINRVLDWTADRIIEEKCDLVLVAGDLFKDSKVMLDRASQEIASIVRFLRKLSDAGIETIVISGTPSHDAIAAYELMKDAKMPKPNVHIYTQPGIKEISKEYIDVYGGGTGNVVATLAPDAECTIACLPGLNRSNLVTKEETKGMSVEAIHRLMTDTLTQLCQGMAGRMPNDKPKILMSHMTYQGADTGFQDLLLQNEPILTREAVAGFDLVCLGHIHKPQQIDDKVFYSGPIERLSFNEEKINPGFWIHEYDITSDYTVNEGSRFIETPARRYLTLDVDFRKSVDLQTDVDWELAGISESGKLLMLDTTGAIVRLQYKCTDEQAKILNPKKLEETLYKGGAFYVSKIEADVDRVDRARNQEVTESIGPVQAVALWCKDQQIPEEEIPHLQTMTAELLREV